MTAQEYIDTLFETTGPSAGLIRTGNLFQVHAGGRPGTPTVIQSSQIDSGITDSIPYLDGATLSVAQDSITREVSFTIAYNGLDNVNIPIIGSSGTHLKMPTNGMVRLIRLSENRFLVLGAHSYVVDFDVRSLSSHVVQSNVFAGQTGMAADNIQNAFLVGDEIVLITKDLNDDKLLILSIPASSTSSNPNYQVDSNRILAGNDILEVIGITGSILLVHYDQTKIGLLDLRHIDSGILELGDITHYPNGRILRDEVNPSLFIVYNNNVPAQ